LRMYYCMRVHARSMRGTLLEPSVFAEWSMRGHARKVVFAFSIHVIGIPEYTMRGHFLPTESFEPSNNCKHHLPTSAEQSLVRPCWTLGGTRGLEAPLNPNWLGKKGWEDGRGQFSMRSLCADYERHEQISR